LIARGLLFTFEMSKNPGVPKLNLSTVAE